MNLRRHWPAAAIVAVIFVIAAAYTVSRIRHRHAFPDPRTISPQQVTSLKFTLYDAEPPEPSHLTLTSREQFNAILASVRGAKPTPKHRCAGRAEITLVLSDGRQVELQILPGHDTASYEYRTRDARTYFKMPREPFVTAMAAAGIRRSLLLRDFDEHSTTREPRTTPAQQ